MRYLFPLYSKNGSSLPSWIPATFPPRSTCG